MWIGLPTASSVRGRCTTVWRAATHGKRLFSVVCEAPSTPVRDEPTREARIVGARATGDAVIADEVRPDGWARVSRALDTREGYELYDHEAVHQAWMLLRDDDAGELLREVEVLDGRDDAAAECVDCS